MNKDLTVGKPGKVLWLFCLPLFCSMIFQQLYNLADSFVAGRFLDESALAAVGISYEITLILVAVSVGSNIGVSVIISHLFGAKSFTELKSAVSTSFLSGAALCAVLVTLGEVFTDGLLRLIHTPEDIFGASALYLRIYVWGFPFVFFYNIATGIFSALGDSRTPFLFLAFSSLANIGMDILFVKAFGMHVEGLAWATLICQGISCLLANAVLLRRMKQIPSDKNYPRFSGPLLKKIASVAVPSILQQSFVSFGNIVIQGVINSFGTAVAAGYAAAIKLNNLIIASATTLANGISNFTGQNLGAQKYARVKKGMATGVKMLWLIVIPVSLLYCLFSEPLLRFFMEAPSQTALSVGQDFLRMVAPFYVVVAVKLAADGVLRGARRMAFFMADTFSDLILRVVLSMLLSASMGPRGIWTSWPIGWAIGAALSVLFYLYTVKRFERAEKNV